MIEEKIRCFSYFFDRIPVLRGEIKMDMKQELAEALVDPKTYKDFDKIHDVFTQLRTDTPVALAKPKGFDPFWFISKFEGCAGCRS
jgi:hypothetical protein